jgi:D-glucuronyl C5-epimerase C-terminus
VRARWRPLGIARPGAVLVATIALALLALGPAAPAAVARQVHAGAIPASNGTPASQTGAATPAGADGAPEPPYRYEPYNLGTIPWSARFFNGYGVQELPINGPRDARGIPMVRRYGALYYEPTLLARTGINQLRSWLLDGDQAHLDLANAVDKRLRKLADRTPDGAWWIPFKYDYLQEHLAAPWYNANSQGMALAFFSRMYEQLGSQKDLNAAGHIFQSFLDLGTAQEPWADYVDADGYLWLEHYPSIHPTHVLSADLYAIQGIQEYWQLTLRDDVKVYEEGALTTVKDNVHRYRRPGKISYYDLYHFTYWPKKHMHVIASLRRIAIFTGDSFFSRWADKFYSDYPGNP